MEYLNIARDLRNMKPSTYKTYKSNLNRAMILLKKKDDEFFNYICNEPEAVLEIFKTNLSLSSQTAIIAVCLVMMSPHRGKCPDENKKAHNIYNTYIKTTYNNYRANAVVKNTKEINNWLDGRTIKANYLDKYASRFNPKMLKNGFYDDNVKIDALRYLILGLYTLLPPRRLDYADCYIINKKDYTKLSRAELLSKNYLVVLKNPLFFSWTIQKSDTDDAVIVDVKKNKDLQKIFKIYFKIMGLNEGGLLLRHPLKDFTRNALTKEFNKIFHPYKISASMLRKIYLTEKFGNVKQDIEKTAEQMNHSPDVALNVYTK